MTEDRGRRTEALEFGIGNAGMRKIRKGARRRAEGC